MVTKDRSERGTEETKRRTEEEEENDRRRQRTKEDKTQDFSSSHRNSRGWVTEWLFYYVADWPQPSNIWTCMCGVFLQSLLLIISLPISDILLQSVFFSSSLSVCLYLIQNLFVFYREQKSHDASRECHSGWFLFHFIIVCGTVMSTVTFSLEFSVFVGGFVLLVPSKIFCHGFQTTTWNTSSVQYFPTNAWKCFDQNPNLNNFYWPTKGIRLRLSIPL